MIPIFSSQFTTAPAEETGLNEKKLEQPIPRIVLHKQNRNRVGERLPLARPLVRQPICSSLSTNSTTVSRTPGKIAQPPVSQETSSNSSATSENPTASQAITHNRTNECLDVDQNLVKTECLAEYVPVYGFYNSNIEEISSVLEVSSEQTHTYTYDDIEMSFVHFPNPFTATDKELIKRQNDVISGNLPFNENVS